ncbi:MAG: hypothetical protein IPK73_29775 [Candidatus Obscuribacter sp.]|nr:hypothetical protein [Candidatus Obscuribacter sp.]
MTGDEAKRQSAKKVGQNRFAGSTSTVLSEPQPDDSALSALEQLSLSWRNGNRIFERATTEPTFQKAILQKNFGLNVLQFNDTHLKVLNSLHDRTGLLGQVLNNGLCDTIGKLSQRITPAPLLGSDNAFTKDWQDKLTVSRSGTTDPTFQKAILQKNIGLNALQFNDNHVKLLNSLQDRTGLVCHVLNNGLYDTIGKLSQRITPAPLLDSNNAFAKNWRNKMTASERGLSDPTCQKAILEKNIGLNAEGFNDNHFKVLTSLHDRTGLVCQVLNNGIYDTIKLSQRITPSALLGSDNAFTKDLRDKLTVSKSSTTYPTFQKGTLQKNIELNALQFNDNHLKVLNSIHGRTGLTGHFLNNGLYDAVGKLSQRITAPLLPEMDKSNYGQIEMVHRAKSIKGGLDNVWTFSEKQIAIHDKDRRGRRTQALGSKFGDSSFVSLRIGSFELSPQLRSFFSLHHIVSESLHSMEKAIRQTEETFSIGVLGAPSNIEEIISSAKSRVRRCKEVLELLMKLPIKVAAENSPLAARVFGTLWEAQSVLRGTQSDLDIVWE